MVDKTPGQIQPGDASDGSFVHATQANDSLSHRHDERNISRLQPQINTFDDTKSFVVGDLVVFEGIQRRCVNVVAASGGTPFDPDDWTAADSLGLKNVITVYNEKDFGPTAGRFISDATHSCRILADNTTYIIGGPITVNDPLFVGLNESVKIIDPTFGQNKITNSSGKRLFNTDSRTQVIDAAVSLGGAPNKVEFQTLNDHLLAGSPNPSGINITTDNYVLKNIAIDNISTSTKFVVTVPDNGTAKGAFEIGAKSFELIGISTVEPVSGEPLCFFVVTALPDVQFTDGIGGIFKIKNVTTEGADGLGDIFYGELVEIDGVDIILSNNITTTFNGGKNVIIRNIFAPNTLGADLFTFADARPERTFMKLVDISNVIARTADDDHLFHFQTVGVPSVSQALVANINNCKDVNENNTEYFSDVGNGLNETAKNFYVSDNFLQHDSRAYTRARWNINNTNRAEVNINNADVFVPLIDDTLTRIWSFITNKFTLTDFSGEVKYIALKPIHVLINFVATVDTDNSSNRFIKLQLNHNSSSVNTSRVTTLTPEAANTVSGTWILTLNHNDTLKLEVANGDDAQDLTFDHAVYSVTEIG